MDISVSLHTFNVTHPIVCTNYDQKYAGFFTLFDGKVCVSDFNAFCLYHIAQLNYVQSVAKTQLSLNNVAKHNESAKSFLRLLFNTIDLTIDELPGLGIKDLVKRHCPDIFQTTINPLMTKVNSTIERVSLEDLITKYIQPQIFRLEIERIMSLTQVNLLILSRKDFGSNFKILPPEIEDFIILTIFDTSINLKYQQFPDFS